LDGVVLAACSCCSLEQICYSCTYQRIRCKGNLIISSFAENVLFEFINIREQCAWVHSDEPERAKEKAIRMIEAAVERVAFAEERMRRRSFPVERSVLIIGGGAGDWCADALSLQGFRVLRSDSPPPAIYGSVGKFVLPSQGRESRVGAIVLVAKREEDVERLQSSLGVRDLIWAKRQIWSPFETRMRGVFVCGPSSRHSPMVEGLAVAAEVAALLGKGWLSIERTVACVTPSRCRACGKCEEICDFYAIKVKEDSAKVEEGACRGCGTCVAHCPSGAIVAGYSTDKQIEAALKASFVVFTCNWQAYSALEMAGFKRLSYPADVSVIKLMCLGRLHSGLILKAFELGAEGVLLLGCPPGECHYGFGNKRAEEVFAQAKAITHLLGIEEERLKLDWVAADDGEGFVHKIRSV
jgi:heterodisulfide reductase subunit A-like polyferredoxin